MEWLKKTNSILIILTGIFGLYAGAASIGLNIPRWAWISEVHAAENKINDLRLSFEQMRLDSLKRSQLDIISRIAELEAKGITPPSSLSFQLQSTQDEILIQTERLNKLLDER